MSDTLERLRARIADHERLLVAYSGGADSAFLAYVAAAVLGDGALAVTAVSPSLPARERDAARTFASTHGIAHIEVLTDEGDRPEYIANDGQRCFHCKEALFDALEPMARLSGAAIALGTNLDDLGDHRPGQEAARRRGAIAPLVDAGLTKSAVRAASAHLGLTTAAKPAAACLASRVAYGEPVSPELLGRIEAAEDALIGMGFAVCRVRSHGGGTVGRVELPADRLDEALGRRDEIDAALRAAGFTFVALDLRGFTSGSMNALLEPTLVPVKVERRGR